MMAQAEQPDVSGHDGPVKAEPDVRDSACAMQAWGAEPGAGLVAILLALAAVLLITRTCSNHPSSVIILSQTAAVSDAVADEDDHEAVKPNDPSLDTTGVEAAAAVTVIPDMRIDLNRADEFALQSIPSIGPVLARRIVEERNAGGPFASLEQLAERVKGIGLKTIERIEQYVVLSHDDDGACTADSPDFEVPDGGQ